MKRLVAAALAAVMVLSFAACGSKPAQNQGQAAPSTPSAPVETVKKDTLTYAIMTDPEGLDPQKTNATSTQFVTMNIYEPLVIYDDNWNVQGRIAESWDVADDFMSVTFKIKEGVKFHNGRTVTAEDVKFSIERLHEDDSPKKKYYANITGCEVIDEYTVKFTCDKPDAVLLSSFAYPWSIIIPQECADTLKTNPVGTGAYKFVDWTPQQDLHLTAFEDYHDTAANIKNVTYKIVPDATTGMVGILDGSIDLIDVTGNRIDPIEGKPGVEIYKKGVNSVTVLGMNLGVDKFTNPTLRKAIASAIDKDEIIQAVNQGFADKVGSYLPSSAAEYIDTNDVIPYDVEAAKALLAEAGYANGLTLKLTLPKSYPSYSNIGLIIADQLEKVGVHCDVEMVEWADWMQNVYTDKNYEMTVMANSGRLSSYDFISRFASTSNDYISYRTGEADEILTALKNELDADARTQLIKDFEALIAAEVPVVPIETQQRIFAMSADLQGLVMYPTETTEFKILSFK